MSSKTDAGLCSEHDVLGWWVVLFFFVYWFGGLQDMYGVVRLQRPMGVSDRWVLETMPHVQSAGDIRRRDDDAVRIAIALRRKIAALLPCLIPVGFELLGLVSLFHDSLRLLESFE